MSEWVLAKREGRVLVLQPDGREDALAAAFLERLAVRGRSRNTIEAYAFDLVIARRWMGYVGVELEQLTTTKVHEFLAWERGRQTKPKSINRRLQTLRLFYRHVTDKDLPGTLTPRGGFRLAHRDRELGIQLIQPRATRVLRVKEPRTVLEPLTVDQVNELLQSLSRYRDLAIAFLMLLCGLRSQEVLNLQSGDIDLVERRLKVRGKGGKERSVPVPPLLLTVLQKYAQLERPEPASHHVFVVMQGRRRGEPMTRAGLRRVFRTRRRRKSLANANPHRLRHTFGTDMARAGVRLPILQKMMGHSFLETTVQYISLSLVDVEEEFKRALANLERRYELEVEPRG